MKYLHGLFAFGSLTSARTDAANSYFVCYLVSIVIKTADLGLIRKGFSFSVCRTVMFVQEAVRWGFLLVF